MINLDYQSRTPIYEQIIKQIEKYVSLGVLNPKEQIPSIREMASTLGINPNTVKKAYSELENKGVIQTFSTKGTFISENVDEIRNINIDSKINEIKGIINELEKIGVTKDEIIEKLK